MFIQVRSIVVKLGHVDTVVADYAQSAYIDGKEGLIDRTVMVNRKSKDSDEVVIIIRWQSEEAWKGWEKDPVHIAGHRERRGESPPDYIISSSVNMYDAKGIYQGTFGQEQS